MFPVIMYFVITGHERLFVILFVINLITDVLDGFIARRFNMGSEFGVMLDSWADVGSYIIAFAGVIKFHGYIITDYAWWIGVFIASYFGQMLLSKLKFGKWVMGWHAYSSKVNGYLQALFFVVLFSYGFIPWFFIVVIITGLLCETELIILNLICREPVQNVKGLYWYLKYRKA
jgi:hypothetical protein